MATITMTTEQTAAYDSADEREAREMMSDLIAQAQRQADAEGVQVEIYTADGIVAEVVLPQ